MTDFIQYTPNKRYQVTTIGRQSTLEELLAEEAYLDSMPDKIEEDEDQDSDGYGWERAALRRIG